ncbi:MAG: monoamine oxidase [Acidobacteriota bacterium]|nr:monoamine oxidase [Acidobacteriota bacterium]
MRNMKQTTRRTFLKQGVFATAALSVPARVRACVAPFGESFGRGRMRAPRKVVIIGAGLAGLAAGYELTQAGHDVRLLEAQQRPGGRVFTLRTFDGGHYADAGAARIPDNHVWTLRYVKEFGLRLLPFYPGAGLFVRLKHRRRSEVGWDEFRDAVGESIGIDLDDGRGWHKIEGGNDLLPRAFAERLAGKVTYGAPVLRVEQDAGGVRVTFTRDGRAETLAADYVVCAIPFAVLGRVAFAPALSEQKRKVRDQMSYEFASRAFMQTRGRFWERRGGANGFAVTDLPAEFWPSTFGQPGAHAVLQAYVRHSTSLEWLKKAEGERIAAALALTEQVLPGVRADFERGVVKCWGEDEWAGCAWTHPTGPQLVGAIAPEGRIHFAGEHTSIYASWMNGALESGTRAARELEEASRSAA